MKDIALAIIAVGLVLDITYSKSKKIDEDYGFQTFIILVCIVVVII